MDHKEFIEKIKEVRKNSSKRSFTQTFDLSLNIKGIDLKKPVNQIDIPLFLPYPKGKKLKICAFVDKFLVTKAKEVCDYVIQDSEFEQYMNNKIKQRKLAKKYDVFIAQANLMPDIAKVFGRVLGPRGKMPNPKAGQIIPPKGDIKEIVNKQNYFVHLKTKTQPVIHVPVGNEKMKDEEIAKNIERVIDVLSEKLPQGVKNIKSAYLKLTMGKSVKLW